MATDLSIATTGFVLVMLVLVLSAFFEVTDDGITPVTPESIQVPGFNPKMVANKEYNATTGEWEQVPEDPDILKVVGGAAMVIAGGLLIPWSGGWSIALMVAGGVLAVDGAAPGFVDGLPVVGAIAQGLDGFMTAVAAFLGLSSFMIDMLWMYPLVAFAISFPFVFFFFVFAVRVARGQ